MSPPLHPKYLEVVPYETWKKVRMVTCDAHPRARAMTPLGRYVYVACGSPTHRVCLDNFTRSEFYRARYDVRIEFHVLQRHWAIVEKVFGYSPEARQHILSFVVDPSLENSVLDGLVSNPGRDLARLVEARRACQESLSDIASTSTL